MFSEIEFLPEGDNILSLWDIPERLIESPEMRRPLDRICELMRRHGTEAVAIHYELHKEPYFDKICTHLREYLRDTREIADVVDVIQVSFFSCPWTADGKKRFPKTVKKQEVLGMCVIVKLQFKKPVGQIQYGEIVGFVYEAVLRFPGAGAETARPSGLPNNYYHVFSNIAFWIDGKQFELPSSYFCQSDGVEAACSQASLRMALFHSEGRSRDLPSYREMNNIVRDCRKQIPKLRKQVFNPFDGYFISDIRAFLESQSMHTLDLDCGRNPSISPYEWAYLLVESGIPTLIVFSPQVRAGRPRPDSHVILVVGHTTNYDEWLPHAHSFYRSFDGFSLFDKGRGYIPSSSWASHLVVQDDPLGPYHCLGERDLIMIRQRGERALLRSRIQYVIGVVPKPSGFTISPYAAQHMAAYCFKRYWRCYTDYIEDPWRARFKQREGPLASHKTLVLRTQLIGRQGYLDHLRRSRDYLRKKAGLPKATIKKLSRALPEKFWMTEFTCPQLYAVNRAKFGEVLLKFNPTQREFKAFGRQDASQIYLGLRFINHLSLPNRDIEVGLGFRSHIGLFRRQKAAVEY
jgi:hypothetical protein